MSKPTIALVAVLALALPGTSLAKSRASVVCKDGTTSVRGRGACSHHGGIDRSASTLKAPESRGNEAKQSSREAAKDVDRSGSAQPRSETRDGGGLLGRMFGRAAPRPERERSAPATPRGPATARCKDGSLSYSQHRSGTCSGHGGVGEWLRSP